jgi:hypothetical protein
VGVEQGCRELRLASGAVVAVVGVNVLSLPHLLQRLAWDAFTKSRTTPRASKAQEHKEGHLSVLHLTTTFVVVAGEEDS